MAQEAPADMAGPSSPPPQLPDGWLPQWEGIQRKWYFVQRATGKSQWEIPTEPVVLTPSTTPTSIGTGPTHPPSRPSTNSPQVSGPGISLAGRFEPVGMNARAPSSLDGQLNGQPDRSIYGPSGTNNWYPSQTTQQIPHGFNQHVVPNESHYGSQPYQDHGSSSSQNHQMQGNFQPDSRHQPLAGGSVNMPWGGNTAATQIPGGYTLQQPRDTHLGFLPNPHHSQPVLNNDNPSMTQAYPANLGTICPPEPQWHPSQPLGSNAPPDPAFTGSSSTIPQQLYRSYPTPRTVGESPSEFISRSSRSSNPSQPGSDFTFSRENSQSIHGTLPIHPPHDMENISNGALQSMSRSHSQQFAALPPHTSQYPEATIQPAHRYQQYPTPSFNQYQATNMSRTHSSTNYSPSGYSASGTNPGGAGDYQNPLVKAGMHQYLPSPQHVGHLQGGHHLAGAGNSLQNGTPSGYQNQSGASNSIGLRSAASDPQFVSGPWSSTPPASGPT
ncbi:hypothetical protein PENSTE_c003G00864 [Penicillium steckii]|uniref:WW domain-containing protein n=1 Tax=Penicillium steckii TaxID=303698 RepID=A0A1V6TSH1_9EURO|nr:hypothetical protein PENSTE_c003G00864 [Penicillium steckii]